MPETTQSTSQVYNGQGELIGSIVLYFQEFILRIWALANSLGAGIYIYKLSINSDQISNVFTGKLSSYEKFEFKIRTHPRNPFHFSKEYRNLSRLPH